MNCRVRNNPGPRSEPYLRFPHLQSADRQQTDWPGILYYPSYCRVYHLACVDKDDTNSTIDKIAAADMILFATPVYWWGMSAQLKLIIDKCYCRGLQLKNKKVGTIVVGGSPVDSIQYELIDKQFDCMAKYLSWDMLFKKSYYATARDELEKNKDSMNELEWIGKNL